MALDVPGSDFSPDDIDTDFTIEDLEVGYEPDSPPPSSGFVDDCDAVFASDGLLAESARRDGRL